jgi:hypothetical protein
MKEVFAAVAEQEKGEFDFTEAVFNGHRGSKVFVTYYRLELDYKGNIITINYELGNHNMAKIELEIKNTEVIPQFLVTNRSQYYRLLYRKANILKVECDDVFFKRFIKGLFYSTGLELIARDNLFEPRIRTSLTDNGIKILVTDFNVAFSDKKDALLALIDFYKCIVDYSENSV